MRTQSFSPHSVVVNSAAAFDATTKNVFGTPTGTAPDTPSTVVVVNQGAR